MHSAVLLISTYVCTKDHQHARIAGSETKKTALYPRALATLILSHLVFRMPVLPAQLVEGLEEPSPESVQAASREMLQLADPFSTRHLMCHRPALPNCPVCMQAKQRERQPVANKNRRRKHRILDPKFPQTILFSVGHKRVSTAVEFVSCCVTVSVMLLVLIQTRRKPQNMQKKVIVIFSVTPRFTQLASCIPITALSC